MFIMLRRTHRRRLDELQRRYESQRDDLNTARHALLRLKVELELVNQARTKADVDAAYWKTRAERFMDQIGVRAGIISGPTMGEPEQPVESRFDSVLSALGKSEINVNKGPEPGAVATAPLVTGVNAADAMAAVNDVLATVR